MVRIRNTDCVYILVVHTFLAHCFNVYLLYIVVKHLLRFLTIHIYPSNIAITHFPLILSQFALNKTASPPVFSAKNLKQQWRSKKVPYKKCTYVSNLPHFRQFNTQTRNPLAWIRWLGWLAALLCMCVLAKCALVSWARVVCAFFASVPDNGRTRLYFSASALLPSFIRVSYKC